MKKPRKSIQPKAGSMEPRLFIAIVASAVFAGVFAGLVIIGYHGLIETTTKVMRADRELLVCCPASLFT